jgi:nucleoside-diphosphate-sugar epimerase
MRILIAGATGAIGRPLVRCLKGNRHSVFALARSPKSSRAVAELGAESVIFLMPPGTLICNGQAVSRTTYANLFNEIGTSYGNGDGVSTFNVPSMGGNFFIKY